jgi:integrase
VTWIRSVDIENPRWAGVFRKACKPECPQARSSGGRKAAQRRSDEESYERGTGRELLGHKHLDSTQRYTRVNAHELRGAIKRLRWVG